jgi:predicted RNA binding protein YcfA (HicA-like mRNA interferase family)
MSNNRKTVTDLRRAGYIVEKTGGSHLSIRHPTQPGTVFASSTPGDIRSMRNVKAKLKRTFGKQE